MKVNAPLLELALLTEEAAEMNLRLDHDNKDREANSRLAQIESRQEVLWQENDRLIPYRMMNHGGPDDWAVEDTRSDRLIVEVAAYDEEAAPAYVRALRVLSALLFREALRQ